MTDSVSPANTMQDCPKVRFVVGVFHSVARLKSASESLRRHGVKPGEIILLGCPGALDGKLEDVSGGFLAGSVVVQDGASPDIVDSDGNVLKRQVACFDKWIAPLLARELKSHLARGGCLLFVSTSDSGLETKVGEILLRESADSVQSHEFAVTH